MKGKFLKLKTTIIGLLVLVAGFGFAFGSNRTQTQMIETYAAAPIKKVGDDEYSALFGDDRGSAIFSVEKVAVSTKDVDNDNIPDGLTEGYETFYSNYNHKTVSDDYYTFRHIPNGLKTKTVVEDGQFVKMDNKVESGNVYKTSDTQEAIMISFGSYVYHPKTDSSDERVEIADENGTIHSQITSLEVVIKKNNVEQQIPSIRNIRPAAGGLYFDFAYLITQDVNNTNEGYYQIYLVFNIAGVKHTANFSFYIVNNSSYIQSIGPNYGYNANPTLGWVENGSEFSKVNTSYEVDNYVRYKIGAHGISDSAISYPTLTYDYTRYKLSYIKTSNQKTTTYDLSVRYDEKLNNQEAYLVISKTEQGITTSTEYSLDDYDSTNSINLVTIMFTEPGAYSVDYNFLYKGFNSANAPKMDFEVQDIKFSIFGMSLQYSKAGYKSAEMQCFEIASTPNNNIDLIVPNGYMEGDDISNKKDQSVGFIYSLVDSEEREGNVVLANSVNSMVNSDLKNDSQKYGAGSGVDALTYLVGNSTDLSKSSDVNLTTILNKIPFAKTNQGSLWLIGNDKFTTNSFYFYSSTGFKNVSDLFTEKEVGGIPTTVSAKRAYTNTTSFNAKGYYLVFLEVKPNGINDADSNMFWQVFAFQYTSDSTNITIEAINDNGTENTSDDTYEDVAGRYTNKNVRISWKKPGIFDRNVNAEYYSVVNQNLTKDNLLLTGKKYFNISESEIGGEIYQIAYLGSEVAGGTFVKYLISLKNEGDSVTYKMFTIDRQNISGIKAYLVQQVNSGNSIFYSYATNVNNSKIEITNSVTDGLAALTWNNKASGSEIFASYSYTPFTINSADPETIVGNGGKQWITTNYQFGQTISGADLVRPENSYSVPSDSILFNQGVYIIKLWDSAGNQAYYAFVIDRTNGYFNINYKDNEGTNKSTYLTNSFAIYGDNVTYSVGDYKAFKLFSSYDSIDEKVKELIQKASEGNLHEFENYYTGADNNIYSLSKIFQKHGSDYYLTIQNKSVLAYENSNNIAEDLGLKNTLRYNVEDGSSYYTCKLYLSGENHINSQTQTQDKSYVKIEINKDNARGYVYYQNDYDISAIPTDGSDVSVGSRGMTYKLKTGSDDSEKDINGLMGAHATSANHVMFIWNMGTGPFEVEKVTYKYYSLNLNNFDSSGKYYFYSSEKGQGQEYVVYNKGDEGTYFKKLGGTGMAIIDFDNSSTSKAGLYVVTRTYVGDQSALGADVKEKNYYFIVDRNGIINTTAGIGDQIKICLMEDETEFDTFSGYGYIPKTLIYQNDGINEKYNVYLETTKLPATISIPTGKYVKGMENSSGYQAGRLKVAVYFRDLDNQLPLSTNLQGGNVKIYDSTIYPNSEIYDSKNNTFNIDIYDYLSKINSTLRDRLTISDDHGNWLFLSGDYVIRISDNVENGRTDRDEPHNNEKFIGLSIKTKDQEGPKVDTFTGFETDQTILINPVYDSGYYHATVSQEFLEVRLPNYSLTETQNAQVDKDYLIVTQFDDGKETPYINHPYTAINGIRLDRDSEYVTLNDDGSISVWLDTKLDVNSLDKSLSYTIKIRYKLNNFKSHELISKTEEELIKYLGCYVYYTASGEAIYYYENNYKITIDRLAPTKNIEELNKSDVLVNEYNEEFETEYMFENSFDQRPGAQIYFTRQYAKYYQYAKNNQKYENDYIYAYRVFETTDFYKEDVAIIYVKEIGGVEELKTYSLTLPFFSTNGYSQNYPDLSKYGELMFENRNLMANTYYEIIEQDAAGNVAQYVIHYNPGSDEIHLPVNVKTTSLENKEVDIAFETNEVDYNIFEISLTEDSTRLNDNFFKIVVRRTGAQESPYQILTKSGTNFEKLNQQIVKYITQTSGFGNYEILIKSRTKEKLFTFNYCNSAAEIVIDIKNLVVKEGEQFKIVLSNAKAQDKDHTMWYFAETIRVTTSLETSIYHGKMHNGEVKYYNELNPNIYVSEIKCLPETTYILSMVVLNSTSSYRFNTADKKFTIITYGKEGTYFETVHEGKLVSYTYDFVEFKFDKTIYIGEILIKRGNSYISSGITPVVDGEYKKFVLEPIFDEITGEGGLLEYKVILNPVDGESDEIYFFTIDTRLSSVVIRDYSSGTQKKIYYHNNKHHIDVDQVVDQPTFGTTSLKWTNVEENEYFDYEYNLYELLKDGTYRTSNLTGQNSLVISTPEDSSGIYKFEVKVYTKDGKYAGNRIYLFEVQPDNNQVYFVRDELGNTITSANSKFRVELLEGAMISEITTKFANIKTDLNLPLYVTNQNLNIGPIDENVAISKCETSEGLYSSVYEFVVYQVKKENVFEIYFGVLKFHTNFAEKTELIKDFGIIVNGSVQLKQETTFTVVEKADSEIEIKATRINPIPAYTEDYLFEKNELWLEVRYKDQIVSNEKFKTTYSIEGNGNYSFLFKDTAGNIHEFKEDVEKCDIYVLREVVTLINGQSAIDNAYYNGVVSLTINESYKYITGSIKVEAKRNGETYKPSGYNPYTFSHSGTYRVKLYAKYQGLDEELTKIITFTIINEKEARKSIDLTGLGGCKITSVKNQFGDDVTNKFLNIMLLKGSMNITYEDIMENAEDLNVTSGKQTFSIKYSMSDGIYPTREIDLSFTLNNEDVSISCSLQKGETTTKGFTIYFNAAVIYEKVGESYIYINDRLVAHVNELSANAEQQVSTTYDEFGEGGYYVKLMSTSGVLLDCYKVTIKEPLNASAIIIIIVVVAVVATVVISVIVLRRKMRIR